MVNLNPATVAFVCWILVVAGGINWLLVGIGIDIFGISLPARLIYIIIGLAACYLIYLRVQNKPQP